MAERREVTSSVSEKLTTIGPPGISSALSDAQPHQATPQGHGSETEHDDVRWTDEKKHVTSPSDEEYSYKGHNKNDRPWRQVNKDPKVHLPDEWTVEQNEINEACSQQQKKELVQQVSEKIKKVKEQKQQERKKEQEENKRELDILGNKVERQGKTIEQLQMESYRTRRELHHQRQRLDIMEETQQNYERQFAEMERQFNLMETRFQVERMNNPAPVDNDNVQEMAVVDVPHPVPEDEIENLERIDNVDQDWVCSVCRELPDVRELPCGHRFHFHCIQRWLRENNTCPNCREHVYGNG